MKRVIISRTDSIGDVVLTLPLAGIIKERMPGTEVLFLGQSYTQPVVEACEYVDQFIDWSEKPDLAKLDADAIMHVFPNREVASAAKQARIPMRIGSSRRWFHLTTCTDRIWLKRSGSPLHEAQLNLQLLAPLMGPVELDLKEISTLVGLKAPQGPGICDPNKYSVVVHPLSKGSAREWGMENFTQLITLLDPDRFEVLVTGTQAEREKTQLPFELPNVKDLMGKQTLKELIGLLGEADGIVACSTGPLHIAACLGSSAIGIYAPLTPIHPRRWAPLGVDTKVFFTERACRDCKRGGSCHCIQEVSAGQIADHLDQLSNLRATLTSS
jgi:ADP-heptose:LPS heptosyltransferase